MPSNIKNPLIRLLRWSERYTNTDMVYLASTGWWTNLGTVIIAASSLLLYVIFANFLSKETYGTYQYLLSIAAIASAFTLTGMNNAVARAVARGYDGALKESVRMQLHWGLIPATGAFIISVYYFLNGNIVLGAGLLCIALFTPLNAAFGTYGAFLQGKQDFKRAFLYGMGWNIPYYIAVGCVAIFSQPAIILLFASLASQCVALWFFYRKTISAYNPANKTDPETIPYGKHMSAMNLLSALAAQADTVLAFHFLGAAELALYSFATAIPERLGSFFKFIQTAALPRLSKKEPEQIRSAFGSRIWFAIAATSFAVLAYVLVAPYLFLLLFPTYLEAIPFTQLYALTIIASLAGLFVTGLTAGRRVQELYIFSIASPILQLSLQLGGVFVWGLWGLLVGRIISNFVAIILAATLLLLKK